MSTIKQNQENYGNQPQHYLDIQYELFEDLLFSVVSPEEIRKVCLRHGKSSEAMGILGHCVNELGATACYIFIRKDLPEDEFIYTFCHEVNHYATEKATNGKIGDKGPFPTFIAELLSDETCWSCNYFGTTVCKYHKDSSFKKQITSNPSIVKLKQIKNKDVNKNQFCFSDLQYEIFYDLVISFGKKEEIKLICQNYGKTPHALGILGRYISETGKTIFYIRFQKNLHIDSFTNNFILGVNYYFVEKAIADQMGKRSSLPDFIIGELQSDICWLCRIFGTNKCTMKYYGRCLMPFSTLALVEKLEYRYTLRCVSTQN